MPPKKVSLFFLLLLTVKFYEPAEAGVIQKVKDTFGSVKSYILHGHGEHKHCGQSDEVIDNAIEKSQKLQDTTTGFPDIDIRFAEEETTTIEIPNFENRNLIKVEKNVEVECPKGTSLGVGGVCRREL